MTELTEQKSTAWVHKVSLGIHVLPEKWSKFQRIALTQRKSTSVLLAWAIEEACKSGFKIYDVAPKYGQISDATMLTTVNLLPEHKAFLKEWSAREECSITKIIRALIDQTVENFKGKIPEIMESTEQVPLYLFQWCIDYRLTLGKIVSDLLKGFADADVQELLKGYTGDGENLIDGEFDFTDEQVEQMTEAATKNNLTLESVKLAFILYVRQVANQQIFRNCYVPKEMHARYKAICISVFTTVSMMMDSHVAGLAWRGERTFRRLQKKYGSNDEELQRINLNMSWRTKLILESVCEQYKVKMSEAIRLSMYASYEVVSNFDVEKVRNDLLVNYPDLKDRVSAP